jgi:hypothetical protein
MYLFSLDATLKAIPNTTRLKNHTGNHSMTMQKPMTHMEAMKITLAVGLPNIANIRNTHTERNPAIKSAAAKSGIPKKSPTTLGNPEISIGISYPPLMVA